MIDLSSAGSRRRHAMLRRRFASAGILAIAALLAVPAGVAAQETEDEQRDEIESMLDDENEQEEIVVVGSRVEGGGRRADASRQQLEDTFETDMAGFFDDIEGISTLGGDGEGNDFSIDGLSPDLAKVSLDGQSFGQGRGNGGFGAGDLPPEMVLRVNVHRTPVAAMEEGGAGGRVNLQVRDPVDLTKPADSLKGRLGYVRETSDFSPMASYFRGRRADNGTFGYMLSAGSTTRDEQSSAQDISRWAPFDIGGAFVDIPQQVRNNDVDAENDNYFAGFVLGYRPRPSLHIKGKLFLARKEQDTENQGLQHRFERQRDVAVLDYNDRVATHLESDDASRANLRVVGSTRKDVNDSLVLGADFDWRSDTWRAEGAIGYSLAKNRSQRPSQTVNFGANSPFGYVANDDASLVSTYPGGIPENVVFTTNRVSLTERDTRDTNAYGEIDLTRSLGERLFRRIQFGAKLRELTRTRDSLKGVASTGDLALSGFAGSNDVHTPWDTAPWTLVDMDGIDEVVRASAVDWEQNLLNEHDIEQRIGAGYVQADFRVERNERRLFAGNLGVRAVRTETRIDGYQDLGEGPAPVSLKTSYSDYLPSLSLRVRVAERSAVIVGIARVMTRPQFNDLAPGVRFNFSDKTAKSGNPELLPFRANQYVLEAGWIPVRGMRLVGNVTYRDVKSFFAIGEETIEIDDDTYLLTRPANGNDASILSAGLRYQQNLRRWSTRLRNIALELSFTHNDSSTDFRDPVSGARLPLPNTAEHVVKADLMWRRDRIGARLRYQRRGKSLKSSFSDSGLAVWNQPSSSVDLNFGWRLSDTVQVGLNARNLLNDDRLQTTDFSGQLLRINERYRQYALTVRASW